MFRRTSKLPPLGRVGCAVLAATLLMLSSACTMLKPYRTQLPAAASVQECAAGSAPTAPASPPCIEQSTERNALYTMHVVEFDDEGWPFEDPQQRELAQIDSAINQIKAQLRGTRNCVRLFVYVHGWRHNANTVDGNVVQFREFLAQVSQATQAAAQAGEDTCDDPALAAASPDLKAQPAKRGGRKQSPAEVKTVGLYVGWRGASIVNVEPLVYASFWDRKNTADRVAQGSVRELFGRLNALASYAPADDKVKTRPVQTSAQLRTYVIGHSFGASVVFRALSQSLIDSFSEDLDVDSQGELASISRFVDMVVLVNPAIEAARFEPVYRAAKRHKARCEAKAKASSAEPCDRPRYQSPVLAVFSSEGDKATGQAFPIGAALSNIFENTLSTDQRQAIVTTIGWDDNYKTHTLAEASTCDGSNASPFDPADDPPRYKAPGWAWCFKTPYGTMLLKHVGQVPPSPDTKPVYNGPLWNVRVPKSIIEDHNDTWNNKFRGLLLHLFTDQRRHPSIVGLDARFLP